MRKVLLLLPVVLSLLCSCSHHSYYQICTVSSDLDKTASGAFEFKDTSCDVVYDFWSEGGLVSFTITNNSNELMYVDLSKSFFIKNGVAHDYFLNRSTASSTASTASSSIQMSTFVAIGNGLHRSNSVSFGEKPIVSIPPHASKVFSEYLIMTSRYIDCDFFESPSKLEFPQMEFNQSNTPVAFKNYLSYRIGESGEDRIVENSFYVSQVRNQHYKATIEKVEKGCPKDKYKEEVEAFYCSSPFKFYIEYSPRKENKKPYKDKKSDNNEYDAIY